MTDQPARVMEVTGDNDYRHNKKSGFIPVWRSIQESSLWSLPPLDFKLFIYMCQEAKYVEQKEWDGEAGCDVWIPVGSFTTSLSELARDVGAKKDAIRRSVERLKKSGKIDTVTTHRKTTITLCNYDYYALRGMYTDEDPTQQQHGNDTVTAQSGSELQPAQRVTTSKQGNKGTKKQYNKEQRPSVREPEDLRLDLIWKDYLETVCAHYGKNPRLTDATRKKILTRLEAGFGLDDFKKVHRNVVADPWEDRTNNCGAALIYRSDDGFQGWLDKDFSVKAKPGTPESLQSEPDKYDNVGIVINLMEEDE